jgi:nitrate reductase NapE component
MEINHKDTKHTKVKDKRNAILTCLFTSLSIYPTLCLRAFVVSLSPLSEEAIDCV